MQNSIAAEDIRVAAAVLDFFDGQRPHFNTLSGQSYVAAPTAAQDEAAVAAAPTGDMFGLMLYDVASVEAAGIPALVALDTAAFVTTLVSFLSTRKAVVALKDVQMTWRALPEDKARRVAKMQNAVLSTLTLFHALVVTENSRGPKITKICRFPVAYHLNAASTATNPPFNTHDACTLLANAMCPQPPIHLTWAAEATARKEFGNANVPTQATAPSDSKVSAARSLLRELRLVFQDKPPVGAPWHIDAGNNQVEPAPKRLRGGGQQVVHEDAALAHAGAGLGLGLPAPPLPPPAPTTPAAAGS